MKTNIKSTLVFTLTALFFPLVASAHQIGGNGLDC